MKSTLKTHYTLEYLQSLPTLYSGQYDNLKLETAEQRVWLSRLTVECGAPCNNEVRIERLINREWKLIKTYQAK